MLPGKMPSGSTLSQGNYHAPAPWSSVGHDNPTGGWGQVPTPEARDPSRPRFGQSSAVFLMFLVVTCFLLSVLTFGPTLEDRYEGFSGLERLGPLKWLAQVAFDREVLERLFWGWLVLAAGWYALGLPRRRDRGLRTLALVLAVLHNAALLRMNYRMITGQHLIRELKTSDIYMRQWPALRQLKIIEAPTPEFPLSQTREELLECNLETFADLHCQVMCGYEQQARRLAEQWDIEDEQKRKTLFIMNFVSGFWAFGNRFETNKPGGVLCNEENNWQEQPLTFRSYLEATVGGCSDQANLTKFLLDREGIENRLTAIPGHVFNEVQLDGRWCVLDATSNLFLEMSWDDLYALAEPGPNSVAVLLFPHPGLAGECAAQYRPTVGHFRLLTLLRIANRPEYFKQTSHPELPACFN